MDLGLVQESHGQGSYKGLKAARVLKRLKMLSLSTAWRLFNATIAPITDYTPNVWMYVAKESAMEELNRAQRVGTSNHRGL